MIELCFKWKLKNIMTKHILNNWDLKAESYMEAKLRYSGFGCEIFEFFKSELSLNLNDFQFYQPINQPEDVIAYYKLGNIEFAVQLDPLCEVICIWNNSISVEINFFVKDYYTKVVEIIKTKIL